MRASISLATDLSGPPRHGDQADPVAARITRGCVDDHESTVVIPPAPFRLRSNHELYSVHRAVNTADSGGVSTIETPSWNGRAQTVGIFSRNCRTRLKSPIPTLCTSRYESQVLDFQVRRPCFRRGEKLGSRGRAPGGVWSGAPRAASASGWPPLSSPPAGRPESENPKGPGARAPGATRTKARSPVRTRLRATPAVCGVRWRSEKKNTP